MCGLFGWQWLKERQPSKHKRSIVAKTLAEEMDRRGRQSWGVWAPELVMRGMGPAEPNSYRFEGLGSMFGHSRFSTHGAQTLSNAHPFHKAGTYLSHNGVLNNHTELNTKFNRSCVVDSEHLLLHLLEEKPFKDITGYGTIVWASEHVPEIINVARLSDNGALAVAKTEYGVVFASTESAVKDALKKAEITLIHFYGIKTGEALFVHKGKLFVDKDCPDLTVTSPPVHNAMGSDGSGYGNWHETNWNRLWCNVCKVRWQKCKHTGKVQDHPYVVSLAAYDKWPEDGNVYVPGAAKEDSKSGTESKGQDQPKQWLILCNAEGCTERQTTDGGGFCAKHKSETRLASSVVDHPDIRVLDGQTLRRCSVVACKTYMPASTKAIMCWHHSTEAQKAERTQPHTNEKGEATGQPATKAQPEEYSNTGQWCKAKGCMEKHVKDSVWCAQHRAQKYVGVEVEVKASEQLALMPPIGSVSATSPKQDVAVMVSNDKRREWQEANGDDVLQDAMLADLASWWLETQHGFVNDVTNGMTHAEVLELAVQMGFDTQEALEELNLDMEQEHDNDNPEPKPTAPTNQHNYVAGGAVQAPTTGGEPSDGGESGPLVVS